MSTPGVPSGWYPDPEAPGQERFWYGSVWASATRPTPSAGMTPMPMKPPRAIPGAGPLVMLGAAALILLGSFLPWVTISVAFATVSANGVTDDRDGWISLGLGIGLGVCAAIIALGHDRRVFWPVAGGVIAAAAVGVAIYEMIYLSTLSSSSKRSGGTTIVAVHTSIAYGLVILLIASVVGFVGCVMVGCVMAGRVALQSR